MSTRPFNNFLSFFLILPLSFTPSTLLAEINYIYNPISNRLSLGTQRSGVSVSPNLNYSYDSLNRLIQATRPLSGQAEETFEYDLLGNRLLRDGQSAAASLFDSANRLLEDPEFTYSYDANGNLTQKTEKATGAVTSYTYDAENQLIRIDLANATTAEYAYDGLGRRIQKNVGGTLTRYVYDNEDILFEFDASNSLIASYTHGPGIDEPLSMHRGGQLFFYHTDGLGSITDLTSATGSLVQSYVYDSFGNITDQVGSIANPYTYTGREFDAESGLYYYRARYYDARIGRFLQEDPVRSDNLYEFVKNNPINSLDPWGLRPGDKYRTQGEAANDALQDISQTSIADDREFAGWIYRDNDGTYSYTPPLRGTAHSSHPGQRPLGATAFYHTHGAESGPNYRDEELSSADKLFAQAYGVAGYLQSPSGKRLEYDSISKEIKELVAYDYGTLALECGRSQ